MRVICVTFACHSVHNLNFCYPIAYSQACPNPLKTPKIARPPLEKPTCYIHSLKIKISPCPDKQDSIGV